jgi:hypothetical protein
LAITREEVAQKFRSVWREIVRGNFSQEFITKSTQSRLLIHIKSAWQFANFDTNLDCSLFRLPKNSLGAPVDALEDFAAQRP